MNRRDFLMVAGVGFLIGTKQGFAKVAHNRYLFSANDEAGTHFISRVDPRLKTKISHTLPFRAHDLLYLNNEEVIGFGRRPGFLCAKVNFKTGDVQNIEATKGRHFYGHGCLSADKSVLFTTENDFESAQGIIGIRDVNTLKTLGEYSSFGVGPHDIYLMPDNKTLVVANGGIQTHPDFGRRKLNIKSMQPSLVYIDVESGKKLGEYRLDDHLLSIRHLTLTEQGDVGVATQYQGNLYRKQPKDLVAWQRKEGPLTPLKVTQQSLEPCKGYMADLAFDPRQQLLAVTTPRGNRITVWDIKRRSYLYAAEIPEVSGIQFLKEQGVFLVSNAKGQFLSVELRRERAQIMEVASFDRVKWDNHFILS